MNDVGVVERLQHLQLVVDHALVSADIFLQDDFDGDLAGAGIGLANNTVRASTEGSSKLV